jgi:hypothetical protein
MQAIVMPTIVTHGFVAAPAELDAAAERATRGDYFATGEELAKRRRKDLTMNTEVRNVEE